MRNKPIKSRSRHKPSNSRTRRSYTRSVKPTTFCETVVENDTDLYKDMTLDIMSTEVRRPKGFLGYIKKLFHKVITPIRSIVKADDTNHIFLFNFCHGTLPVIKDRNGWRFDITRPHSDLERMIKTPRSACAFSDENDYRDIYTFITSNDNSSDGYFHRVLNYIKNKHSGDLSTIPNQYKRQPHERSIAEFCNLAYRVVYNQPGTPIINKLWGLDDEYSAGIVIMNDITFTLPYTPKTTYENSQYKYPIGTLLDDNKIRYTKGTDIMSCPYFIDYMKLIAGLNTISAYSIAHQFTTGLETESFKIPMAESCCAEYLYLYLGNIPKISHFDMSCEAFYIEQEDEFYSYAWDEKQYRRLLQGKIKSTIVHGG